MCVVLPRCPVLSRRRKTCVRERGRLGAAGGVRRGGAVRGLPRRDASETRRRIRRRSIALWIDRQAAGAATRRTGPDAASRRIRRELIRVTNAASFAADSRADCAGTRRIRQDCDPKLYWCTASGRKDAEAARSDAGARLPRKTPHVGKSRPSALPLPVLSAAPFRRPFSQT